MHGETSSRQASEQADTRIMGIIHGALLRDLARVSTVVSAVPSPSESQRVGVARHVRWMMDFLARPSWRRGRVALAYDA